MPVCRWSAVSVAASVVLAGRPARRWCWPPPTGRRCCSGPERARPPSSSTRAARLSTARLVAEHVVRRDRRARAGSVVLVTGRAVLSELASPASSRQGFLDLRRGHGRDRPGQPAPPCRGAGGRRWRRGECSWPAGSRPWPRRPERARRDRPPDSARPGRSSPLDPPRGRTGRRGPDRRDRARCRGGRSTAGTGCPCSSAPRSEPPRRSAHPSCRLGRPGLARHLARRPRGVRVRPVPQHHVPGPAHRATWEAAQLQLRAAWTSSRRRSPRSKRSVASGRP